MQGLLWKSAVLMAVIGGSCYVVWQAHEGLQASKSEESSERFVSIPNQTGSGMEPEAGDGLRSKLEPAPDFAEAQPTLAPAQSAGDSDHPFRFVSVEEPTPADPRPFALGQEATENKIIKASAEEVTPASFPGVEKLEPIPDVEESSTTNPQPNSASQLPLSFFPARGQAEDSATDSSESHGELAQVNPFMNQSAPIGDPTKAAPTNVEPTPAVGSNTEVVPNPFLPSEAPTQSESATNGPEVAPQFPTPQPLLEATAETADSHEPTKSESQSFGPKTSIPDANAGNVTLPDSQANNLSTIPAPALMPVPDSTRNQVVTADATASENSEVTQVAGEEPLPLIPIAESSSEPPNPFAPRSEPQPLAPPTLEPTPASTIPSTKPENSDEAIPNPFAIQPPVQTEEDDESPGVTSFPPVVESTIPQMPNAEPTPTPAVSPAQFPWETESPSAPEPKPSEPLPLPPLQAEHAASPAEGQADFPVITPASGQNWPNRDQSTIPAATPPEGLPDISPASTIPNGDSSPTRVMPTLEFNQQPNESSIPTTHQEPELETPPISSIPRSSIPEPSIPSPTFNTTPTSDADLVGKGTIDPQIPSGPQAPKIKIEKIAPAEAQIGEPIIYSIIIRNVGGSDAHRVVVEDRIPEGTRLDGTIPQAILSQDKLIWELGTMPAGREEEIQLKVVPIRPGEIGSVATVSFGASVAAKIHVTAPKLSLDVTRPDEAILGEAVGFDFTISNSGQADANDVFLRAILPPGLRHPGGNDIEYEVGKIAAGAQRNVRLSLTPEELGILTSQALVTMNGKSQADVKTDLNILESRIVVNRKGPEKRFVDRSGQYVSTVTNQSLKPLSNVVVTEAVPHGVDIINTAPDGRWDPSRRVVTWTIPRLQSGESRELKFELKPNQPGKHTGKLIADDGLGHRVELATSLDVKGFADLHADVARDIAPVNVGEQISMRMSVVNSGNAAANAVQTAFHIPAELEFVTAQGPAKHYYDERNRTVTFAALEELPADEQRKYDYNVVLTAAQPCEADVHVELKSTDEQQQFRKRVTVLRQVEASAPPFGFTR